jgi:hypothetical protein
MGREKGPVDGGLRWPRAVAHLAIIVVFVLSALGYVPLRERKAEVVTVAADASGTMAGADRGCGTPADTRPADVDKAAVKEAGARTLVHDCDRVRAELAFTRKGRASGTSPDLSRTFNARPAQ